MKASKLFKLNYEIPEGVSITVNRGGTSSGKTYNILLALPLIAWKHPGSTTTVIGQDIPNLKKGAIRDMHNIVQNNPEIAQLIKSYNKTDRVYTLHNDSIIEFTSYEDGQDARSGKREFAFFNEVNGISYDIFDAVYVRTSIHTWVDFNPSSEFWLTEKKFEQRDDVRVIKSTFKHNPFLKASVIERIKSYEPTPENEAKGTADPYRWKVYGQGEYAPLEGAIFKRWTTGEFDANYFVGFGVDFGSTDPTTNIRFGIDDKKKKIYVKEELYETGLSAGSITRKIKNVCGTKSIVIADIGDKLTINYLTENNVNCQPCFKRPGIVQERIRWMQDYQIVVDPNSHNIQNELRNYKWADKKSNTPIDDYNHAIDAMGYIFTYWYMNVRRR